jgi:V8-like Glu-specific endopeptidase
MWGASHPPLLAPDQFQLRYRINTTEGQSGAAVFYLRPGVGDAIAVGIHTHANRARTLNFGTRITPDVKDALVQWQKQGGGV